MCGRFGAAFQYRDIRVQWNLAGDIPLFGPRYNIAPSQEVLGDCPQQGAQRTSANALGLGSIVGTRSFNGPAHD
jgi:hypothetical protein